MDKKIKVSEIKEEVVGREWDEEIREEFDWTGAVPVVDGDDIITRVVLEGDNTDGLELDEEYGCYREE